MSIPKTDDIRKHWDDFSSMYQRIMETTTTQFYYTLYNMINAKDSKNCLEVGCGTGLGILHALNFK